VFGGIDWHVVSISEVDTDQKTLSAGQSARLITLERWSRRCSGSNADQAVSDPERADPRGVLALGRPELVLQYERRSRFRPSGVPRLSSAHPGSPGLDIAPRIREAINSRPAHWRYVDLFFDVDWALPDPLDNHRPSRPPIRRGRGRSDDRARRAANGRACKCATRTPRRHGSDDGSCGGAQNSASTSTLLRHRASSSRQSRKQGCGEKDLAH
jgi:hypothetical protein